MGWKVKFYQTERGKFPVQEFVGNLDEQTRTKVLSYFRLLENYGPYLKPPYIKKFMSGLYELRVTGKTSVRIFYTIVNGEYFLIHGFKKKSDKTPAHELKTAIDRLRSLV